MPNYIKIALPLPNDILFTYSTDDSSTSNLVGRRALVPFGKRTLTGVIVETTNGSEVKDIRRIKPVLEILDEQPIFNDTMMRFTKWIADYYMASWGETLKAALPQGMSPKSLIKVSIKKYPNPDELEQIKRRAPKRAQLLEILMEAPGSVSVGRLSDELDTDSVSAQLSALEQAGWIACETQIEKQVKAKTQRAARVREDLMTNEELLKAAFNELDKRAPKQASIFSYLYCERLKNDEYSLIAELETKYPGAAASIKALAEKELIEISEVVIDRSKRSNETTLAKRDESLLQLTDEQNECLGQINNALDIAEFKSFLLYGVTGSGKTLVYIQAIKKCIESGKNALLLVPEIALTPQLIDRFDKVFPGHISVFHSKMSQGERFDAWRSTFKNECNIIIGARSGLFAPVQNLGLIIVDEEHEQSYKQDSPAPRYQARDAALVRAKLENCVIVLGSATPSFESMHNAINGKHQLIKITHRADGAAMPEVKAIDLYSERKAGRLKGAFSEGFLEAVTDRVNKKEGVIIFQNRRGFASYLECPDCNYIPMCKHCSVALTYHKSARQLRCHYCGYTEIARRTCPECGGLEFTEQGTGTQRIEDELNNYFTEIGIEANIERMDLDTTSRKGAHRAMLERFAGGETDILIGTQMVAKGLDIERVTLVGVVNADMQLFIPDFRASERTFQLLTQVSGRAGRSGELKGEVLIQTAHPDNFAIRAAIAADFDIFFNSEINERNDVGFPPYTRFSMISMESEDENLLTKHATHFFAMIPTHPAVTKLGPALPNIEMIRSMHRRIIAIKTNKDADPSGSITRQALRHALKLYNENIADSKVKLKIDIDSYTGV